jgi:hypothetical protein
MPAFVPKGFYTLEKAVLLLAKERDKPIWETERMTAAEIVAYEGLGETTHYKDLPKTLDAIALGRRGQDGNLPDNLIAERFESYKKCQPILREALHAGELRSVLLIGDRPANAAIRGGLGANQCHDMVR